jgi:hypothetical protein
MEIKVKYLFKDFCIVFIEPAGHFRRYSNVKQNYGHMQKYRK